MKKRIGLTLIETLISLTLFAILSAGVSGVIIASTQLRNNTAKEAKAQEVLNQIVEKHKEHWSIINNFELTTSATEVLPPYVRTGGQLYSDLPDTFSIQISYGCVASDGAALSGGSGPLFCPQANPPLRTMQATIFDGQSNPKASIRLEVGRPISRTKE